MDRYWNVPIFVVFGLAAHCIVMDRYWNVPIFVAFGLAAHCIVMDLKKWHIVPPISHQRKLSSRGGGVTTSFEQLLLVSGQCLTKVMPCHFCGFAAYCTWGWLCLHTQYSWHKYAFFCIQIKSAFCAPQNPAQKNLSLHSWERAIRFSYGALWYTTRCLCVYPLYLSTSHYVCVFGSSTEIIITHSAPSTVTSYTVRCGRVAPGSREPERFSIEKSSVTRGATHTTEQSKEQNEPIDGRVITWSVCNRRIVMPAISDTEKFGGV